MALCRRAVSKKNSAAIPLNSTNSLSLPRNRDERNRGLTLPLNRDGPENALKFCKIHVPGPTEMQTTLQLDNDDEKLRVRDLYSLLNRKIGGRPYSSAYFGLYYQDNTYNAIDVAEFVHNLKTDNLFLLPRQLDLRPGSEEYIDAMDYPQISMLKYKEFQVNKLMPNKPKKKRILGLDRYRIVKIVQEVTGAMSLFQKEHVPIGIHSIEYIKLLETPREFELSYKHPRGEMRKQMYECKTSNDCEDFVNRIRYLMRYLQL